MKTLRKKRGNRNDVDWNLVDWSQPDGVISEAVGLSRQLVSNIRRERGEKIPKRIQRRTMYKLALEIDKLAGKISDREVAERLGISAEIVFNRRKQTGTPSFRTHEFTPEMIAQLGKESDARLAIKWKIGLERIGRKRKELGIPSYRSQKEAASQ